MKLMIRLVTVLLVILIALYGAIIVASESGEVLVLSTVEVNGAPQETRVWTVEYDGSHWVRSGSPRSAWYARLLARPEVAFRLGGENRVATAVPTPAATDTINTLMHEKYGWADDVIDKLLGRDDAIAIRLVTGPEADR